MARYCYEGPVYVFDRCVCDLWYGETWAISKKKAISNLKYQAKSNLMGLLPGSKVTIDEKGVTEIDE